MERLPERVSRRKALGLFGNFLLVTVAGCSVHAEQSPTPTPVQPSSTPKNKSLPPSEILKQPQQLIPESHPLTPLQLNDLKRSLAADVNTRPDCAITKPDQYVQELAQSPLYTGKAEDIGNNTELFAKHIAGVEHNAMVGEAKQIVRQRSSGQMPSQQEVLRLAEDYDHIIGEEEKLKADKPQLPADAVQAVDSIEDCNRAREASLILGLLH